MSFSFSSRRSISLLRRSFLASSPASLIWNYFLSGRWSPALATGHYAAWTLIGSELLRIHLLRGWMNRSLAGGSRPGTVPARRRDDERAKGGHNAVATHICGHQEREHPRRAGRAPGQADRRGRRSLYS